MKKSFAIKILLIAVNILMACAIATFFLGCGPQQQSGGQIDEAAIQAAVEKALSGKEADTKKDLVKQSSIEKIIRSGKMRVGMSTFVPWAMQDKKGEWIGFEIDVAKKLAEDMGVKIEFVPTKWEGLIPSLLTGKFD